MTSSTIASHYNYYWPPEWSSHSATLILYPHNTKTFRPEARQQFVGVVSAIASATERVFVLSPYPVPELESLSFVQVCICPSNDSWARDTAPTIVVASTGDPAGDEQNAERRLLGLDWEFNAYGGPDGGGCYWPCDLDQELADKICSSILTIPSLKVPLVLEGGSIHTDGLGTILTTEQCLLNPNRNPTLSKEKIEQLVLQTTGCSKIIWLPLGLAHDEDTDGHIDNFACFVKPQHVVLAWTDDERQDKDNYQRCRQAMKILESESDAQGNQLVVHKLYLPRPMFYTKQMVDDLEAAPDPQHTHAPSRQVGEQMAASYVNFYISNTTVVVPQFGDKEFDAKAVETLQSLFPDRRAVGVASKEILIGGGNIHCITQQVPALP